MKKSVLLLPALALLFWTCDKVEHPLVKKTTTVGSTFVKNSNKSVAGFRKVLLEDYTGHRCPNCPTGTEIIHNNLIPRYADSLVVVAIHQGNTFASPQPPVYVNDYRTEAGETWGSNSGGFGVFFWPTGIVNRKKYASTLQLPSAAWTTNVPKGLKEPFYLRLDVNTEYDFGVRALNVFVKGTANMDYPNSIKLFMGLMQDSIVSPQDVRGTEVEHYEFEHMFRTDLNGAWGTPFMTSPVKMGDTLSTELKNINIPADFKGIAANDRKLTLIVIAYDESTKVVLQAEKVAIRPKQSNAAKP